MKKLRKNLVNSFPGSYISAENEFVTHRGENGNVYFYLGYCQDETDVCCTLLEELSGYVNDCSVFDSDRRNELARYQILKGINKFLQTDFSMDDMADIYRNIGNGTDHAKAIEFIKSGYDMEMFQEQEQEL